MIPKDAIEILKSIQNGLEETRFLERCALDIAIEALDMAIEALKDRPQGECKTCKHFVKGGLDGKTYVCEHPDIEQDDDFNYAFLVMKENDFCSRYEPKEKKEGDEE